MNPIGCLPQLLKYGLYFFVGFTIILNLIGVVAPFWEIIAEKNLKQTPKLILELPMWAKILTSLIFLSFWGIAFKLGKFENISKGIIFVGISTFISLQIAGFIIGFLRTTIGSYSLLVLLLPVVYLGT